MRGNWLMIVAVIAGAFSWTWSAAACGKHNATSEVLQAISNESAVPPIEAWRAEGPAALVRLLRVREQLVADRTAFMKSSETAQSPPDLTKFDARLTRLDALIDQVGMQRYCSRSGLYWYTDLEKAKAAARASGKPILSLRMLGNLNEDYSCANSRFFRTTLYANEQISRELRENYVLHWKSVRPVPRVTIDFGDGRKLERTLTGNSVHYVLTPAGDVVDALPGLYGPRAFLESIRALAPLALTLDRLPAEERSRAIAHHHAKQYAENGRKFNEDLAKLDRQVTHVQATAQAAQPPARPTVNAAVANQIAAPKGRVERPLIAAALPASPERLDDESLWQAIAALHFGEAELDEASWELIRSENPNAAAAGRLAITKRVVEDPMLRLVRTLQESIALDTVRNEYQLRRRIHQWLADVNFRPEVEALNERVYAELFLTPSSDPWLGLAPPDAYTALPNGGVVRAER
jgi:hypothetical protein